MTTQFISRFWGLLASTLLIGSSFAQVSQFKNLQPAIVNSNHIKVYQNILDEFHKQFAGAENIRWSKLNKKFLANFRRADQKYAALFNPRARLIYKISYGKEKHLPVDIRRWIRGIYLESTITSAIQVQEAGRTIWLINVEDETTFAWVRVENDDVEEVQKYRKSVPLLTPPSAIVKQ